MTKEGRKLQYENLMTINNWDINIYAGHLINRIKRFLNDYTNHDYSHAPIQWVFEYCKSLKEVDELFDIDKNKVKKTVKKKFEY